MRALGISQANMEDGQMRCDVNVSLERKADGFKGNRVEVKNVLGTRLVEKVIEYEM